MGPSEEADTNSRPPALDGVSEGPGVAPRPAVDPRPRESQSEDLWGVAPIPAPPKPVVDPSPGFSASGVAAGSDSDTNPAEEKPAPLLLMYLWKQASAVE